MKTREGGAREEYKRLCKSGSLFLILLALKRRQERAGVMEMYQRCELVEVSGREDEEWDRGVLGGSDGEGEKKDGMEIGWG